MRRRPNRIRRPHRKRTRRTDAVAMNPMEQFTVKPLVPLHIGGYDVSFTNQSLWMCVVVAATLGFLIYAGASRKLVPTRAQSMAELGYEFVAGMIQSAAGD